LPWNNDILLNRVITIFHKKLLKDFLKNAVSLKIVSFLRDCLTTWTRAKIGQDEQPDFGEDPLVVYYIYKCFINL
jgi:hypothetical protein